MSTDTPITDGLPAGLPLGTVYMLRFGGGTAEYEFVSAESYRQLKRELSALSASRAGVPADTPNEFDVWFNNWAGAGEPDHPATRDLYRQRQNYKDIAHAAWKASAQKFVPPRIPTKAMHSSAIAYMTRGGSTPWRLPDIWTTMYDAWLVETTGHGAALSAAPEPAGERVGVPVEHFDLLAHLRRQRAWSEKTFGPGARVKGVVDHIRKELAEIEACPQDCSEWIDVVILALDGAWRAGHSPSDIIGAIASKQAKNEARKWPDWRAADPDKAIEHDRQAERDQAWNDLVARRSAHPLFGVAQPTDEPAAQPAEVARAEGMCGCNDKSMCYRDPRTDPHCRRGAGQPFVKEFAQEQGTGATSPEAGKPSAPVADHDQVEREIDAIVHEYADNGTEGWIMRFAINAWLAIHGTRLQGLKEAEEVCRQDASDEGDILAQAIAALAANKKPPEGGV